MTQIESSKVLAERISLGQLDRFNNEEYYVDPERPGLISSIPTAFKVGPTGQLFRQIAYPMQTYADPNWTGIDGLDSKTKNSLQEGIADEYLIAFGRANSLQDAQNIRERLLIVQGAEQQLSAAGFSGTAARLIATFGDPIEVGGFAMTGGTAMALSSATKVGKLGAFVRSGIITGGTGFALEAYAGQDDPNRGFYEASFAGLAAGIFGGGLGTYTNIRQGRASRLGRQEDIARFEAFESDLRRIEKAFVNDAIRADARNFSVTPVGEKYFSNINRGADAKRIMDQAKALGYWNDDLRTLEVNIGAGRADDILKAMQESPDPEVVIAKLNGMSDEQAALSREAGVPAEAGDFDAVARLDQEGEFTPRQPGNPDFPIDQAGIGDQPAKYDHARFGLRAQFSRSKSAIERTYGSVAVDDAVLDPSRTKVLSASVYSKWHPRQFVTGVHGDIVDDIYKATDSKVIVRRKKLVQAGADVRETIVRRFDRAVDGPIKNISARMSKGFDELRQFAKRNELPGFENVESNPKYFPRVFHQGKIHNLIKTRGLPAVNKWFERSYKAANPGVTDDVAERVGRGMVDIIMDADKLGAIERMGALSGERMDILEEYLKKYLSQAEVDEVVRRVGAGNKPGGSKPATPRAMHRTPLDETIDVDGITLDQMVETNAFDVFDLYAFEVYGAVTQKRTLDAMNLKMGTNFKSIDSIKLAAEDEIRAAIPPGLARDRAVRAANKRLDATWRFIGNKALHPNTVINEIARATSHVTHTLFSGGFGAASMPETGTAIGSAMPQFFKLMPVLPEITRAALGLKLSNQFIKDVAVMFQDTMTGKSLRLAGSADHFDGIYVEATSRFANVTKRAAEAADIASLLEPVTTVQRTGVQALTIQKLFDIASTGKKLSPKRQNALGLTDDAWDRIAKNFKANVKTEESWIGGPRIADMQLSAWDKQAAADLTYAVLNNSRRVVQQNDIGSMALWMTHPTARLLTQYRMFPLAAYENHLLSGISMHDAQAFTELGMSSVMAGTTFIAQTYRQSIGMPEKERREFLEERLSMGSVAAAAFQRAGAFSFMPDAIDFLGARAGLDPIFTYRNTGLSRARSIEDALFSNPTFATANSMLDTVSDVFQAATGQKNLNRSDFRNARKMIPFNKVAGIDNVLRGVERMFPEDRER